jgi:membrane protein YdbS with pleckstrin-like domain
MRTSEGAGDQEPEETRLPRLKLHLLTWLTAFAMIFLASLAATVIAVWPGASVWFTAVSVVIVLAAAEASCRPPR